MDRREILRLGSIAIGLAGGALAPFPIAAGERMPDIGPAPSNARGTEAIDPIAWLDPDLQPAARALLDSGGLQLSDDTIAQSRAAPLPSGMVPIDAIPVEKLSIPGARGMPDVTIFLVNGGQEGSRPAILHTHGGGHVIGSAESELAYLQDLARVLNCILVTVEYRLAPETRYSGSIEDNYAALLWLFQNAERLGVDPHRIALLGESAGGTHAALLAITARDRGEVPVCFQCLVYPMLDDRTGSVVEVPSHIGVVLWDAADNRYGWTSFLGCAAGSENVPRAGVPARTQSLAGLPPAWIGVGGADLFLDEDISYAARLNAAGVQTELLVVPGAFHAFDRLVPNAQVSERFTTSKIAALRRAFGIPDVTD